MFFSVNFFVFLEVLRAFEGLFADLANMRFQRGVNSEMASDVIALCTRRVAVFPLASETKVVGALSADVLVAEMVVEQLGIVECGGAVEPLARK